MKKTSYLYRSAIDKSIPVPMYYQLKMLILNAVESGELQPGDMLPTEAEFESLFGISRTTIRQAIMELVGEGVLFRKKSKGTFVANRTNQAKEKDHLLKVAYIKDQAGNELSSSAKQILSAEESSASGDAAAQLQIAKGDTVVKIKWRYRKNNEANAYGETYLPAGTFDFFGSYPDETDVYAFLERNEGTRVKRQMKKIEIIPAGKRTSEALDIKRGAPVQVARTVSYNADNDPVEYTVVRYPAYQNSFIMELLK